MNNRIPKLPQPKKTLKLNDKELDKLLEIVGAYWITHLHEISNIKLTSKQLDKVLSLKNNNDTRRN